MKKLFICCDREARERVVERAKTAFGHSVAVVEDMNRADMAYVVGKVTPDMQQEISPKSSATFSIRRIIQSLSSIIFTTFNWSLFRVSAE